jgi:hypothetical protein
MAQAEIRTGQLSWRAFARIGLAVALLGAAMAAAGLWGLRREAALGPLLAVTQGRLTAAPSPAWDRTWRARYAYKDEAGRVWEGRARVDRRADLPAAAGDALSVAYLPGDPRVSRLAGDARATRQAGRIVMGLALLAVGAGGGWLAARQSAALRRLGRDGVAMQGVALGVGPAKGAGGWWFALRYAVVGADGARRMGVSRPDGRAAFAGVRRGDPVAVLADPADPARFALARDVAREGGAR